MIYDVIDECYFIAGTRDGMEEQTEAAIQQAVDYHEEIIPQIHAAKKKGDFTKIIAGIREKQTEFVQLLNGLN